MKYITYIICLLVTVNVAAQKVETYYDFEWNPCDPLKARFFSELIKTDSGWYRQDYFVATKKLQMRALFEDSTCKIHNGYSAFFHANGNVSSIGRQIHNKREGICLSFYSNGVMSDSANYHNDVPVDYELRWHANGFLSDSIAHVNDSTDVQVSWFDNGQPSAAGYLLHGKQYGKWQYFHKNGNIAAKEVYDKGKLISTQCFDEAGAVETGMLGENPATFKGGFDGWKTFLERSLYWPPNYKFDKGNMAAVVVSLTVNEEGKVEDVEVVTPFHPAFDDIAVRAVKSSPKWHPAMQHNRNVKYRFRQVVTFQEPE